MPPWFPVLSFKVTSIKITHDETVQEAICKVNYEKIFHTRISMEFTVFFIDEIWLRENIYESNLFFKPNPYRRYGSMLINWRFLGMIKVMNLHSD